MLRARIPVENFLTRLPLFKGLPDETIDRLTKGVTEIEAPRRTIVANKGDVCDGLHIILFGQVKLAVPTPKGHEKVIRIAGPRDTFGESEMFLNQNYMMTAEALSDAKLLHMSKMTVLQALHVDAEFAQRMLASLSGRLNRLMGEVEGYTLRSGTQRVVDYLVSLLPKDSVTGEISIALPTKKGIIASQLNLTHEHFSRILHSLGDNGLIEVKGRTVKIIDFQRLRMVAG